MGSTYCCVSSCWKSIASKHRFPNPSKIEGLFHQWVQLTGNTQLKEMDPKKVYDNYRVCSLHFAAEDFGANNRLKPGVVPSLKLKEETFLQTISQKESFLETSAKLPLTSEPVLSTNTAVFEKDDEIPSTSHECESENVPGTPKGKHIGLLSEVHVSKVKELTPKAKHLYERAKQFKRRAIASEKMRITFKKKLMHASKVIRPHIFKEVVSSMDRIRTRFFESQVENVSKQPRGRRFTLEDKVLALALYKQSGTGYRFLSKLFALPSRKTVMKLLNRVPIRPGLHDEVFTILKAEVKNFQNPLDVFCTLIFDEMSVQPNLRPNLVEDTVEGFEDFGFKKTEKIANHAQVFMLRGISRKWKQPIYFNFVSGAAKHIDIVYILKLIIKKCQEIGLIVVATICDQSQNNSSTINTLVRQTHQQYKRCGVDNEDFIFEINGEKVIPLFDVPHLFKGIRNNLLKYDLHFVEAGERKLAKWDHIYNAYKMDAYLGDLRLMPRLTDAHVNSQRIHKMKVSKCTQVFSHSVAVAINVFAHSGTTVETEDQVIKLDKQAVDTASLVKFLDKLFDSLNGSSFQSKPGKDLRVAVTRSSAHHKFWNDSLQMLQSFHFIRDGKLFTPPSLRNISRTIKNFKEVYRVISNAGFSHMMPRTFNQDPLENFFGKVRQRGNRNINPTAADFTPYYKSLLVNGLTSKHSIGANCEDDESDIFLSLQRLVTQGLPEGDDEDGSENYVVVPTDLVPNAKPVELRVLKYVSGYVAKKIGRQPCDCRDKFFIRETPEDFQYEEFLKFKEYGKRKGLKYVNHNFLKKMKLALTIVKYIFNRDFHKKHLLSHTLKVLKSRISFTSCFHDEKIKTQIFQYFIKINVFNYTTQLNRIMKGQDLRVLPKNSPKIFISAKEIFLKSLKKKKL